MTLHFSAALSRMAPGKSLLAVGLLLLFTGFGCAQKSELDPSEFPAHPETENYLRYQAWLQSQPKPSTGYEYTEKNQHIYSKLNRQIEYSEGEVAYRKERANLASGGRREYDQSNWAKVQNKLAENLEREMWLEQQKSAGNQQEQEKMRTRFQNYERRVSSLTVEQQKEEALIAERKAARTEGTAQQLTEVRQAKPVEKPQPTEVPVLPPGILTAPPQE